MVLAAPCSNSPQSLSPTFGHQRHPSGEEVICGLDLSVYDPDISRLLATEPQELALGPRPQRPDEGFCSSPNPPTAGRRAAGGGPWSPATPPLPGSLFISQPTHCGPPSRSSWALVPGRLEQCRRSSLNPPTCIKWARSAQEPKEQADYHFEYRGPGPDCPPELWSPTSAHRPGPCGARKKPQPSRL